MNEPLLNSQRYPLQHILIQDIFAANKLAFCLLFAIVITAVGTVWITYQTRALISQKSALTVQKEDLENEYVNLRLEETTLSNNSRIESIAINSLGMNRVKPEQEVVILE
ncbi:MULTISPECIES: cell division protein FtsL [unclassified Lonepinella]|uniref:cell division protein FtsL n=1 Tax=unclassified Lonepinella TaxID=2642006 RepID=UPI0036DAE41E